MYQSNKSLRILKKLSAEQQRDQKRFLEALLLRQAEGELKNTPYEKLHSNFY